MTRRPSIQAANGWPIQLPDRLWGGMAAKIEAAKTAAGDYPPEWPAVAWLVKTIGSQRKRIAELEAELAAANKAVEVAEE